jgi:hypothetical protein
MAMRVLTGKWKSFDRVLRRRVNDDLSDALSDAADAWLSTKSLPLLLPLDLHFPEAQVEVIQEVIHEGVIG